MKKILAIVAFFAATACAFSGEAFWNFGIGLGIPNYKYDVEDFEMDLNAVDLDFSLLRIAEKSGITLKFTLDMGVAWTDKLQKETSIGFDFRSDVGLGWTPIRTERFFLTATGLLGVGVDWFTEKTKYTYSASGNWGVKEEEVTEQWSFMDVYAGIEATAQLKLGEYNGLYATIGYRKLLVGQYGDRIDGATKSGYYYGWKDGSYANLEKADLTGTMQPYLTFGWMVFM